MNAPLGLSPAVQAAMREVAEKHILPRFKKLAEADIKSKSHPNDLVTIADVESEHALTRMLPALLPRSCVVGEEAVAADDKVMDLLGGSDPVWVVDPIDGTSNFIKGSATFAVMIALVQRGETIMGWIHDPIVNSTLWAEKGAGAWLSKGQNTTAVKIPSPPESLKQMTAGIYSREFAPLTGMVRRVTRLNAAAHDYWSLTDGRAQIVGFGRLRPWDHAAGLLIHSEAGGYNGMISGRPYAPAEPDQTGVVAAPNREIWQAVVDAVNTVNK
jgi:fructose-1,6-bisphosphatase/inositol monophosphatase family enzyme